MLTALMLLLHRLAVAAVVLQFCFLASRAGARALAGVHAVAGVVGSCWPSRIPSSSSMMSDEDSESELFFKWAPAEKPKKINPRTVIKWRGSSRESIDRAPRLFWWGWPPSYFYRRESRPCQKKPTPSLIADECSSFRAGNERGRFEYCYCDRWARLAAPALLGVRSAPKTYRRDLFPL